MFAEKIHTMLKFKCLLCDQLPQNFARTTKASATAARTVCWRERLKRSWRRRTAIHSFMLATSWVSITLNWTQFHLATFVRSENAKSVIVGVDAFHQEGLEQVRHLQGGRASSVQGHSEQVVHVGNGESVVRVVVLNIASTQSPQIWDPVHGHNATCLSSCTDQTNLVQTTMAKYPAK